MYLGATCSTELDPSVTHVISKDSGTEKSHWALKHNKFLVQPGWIEAANYFWQRQPEENFSFNQIKNCLPPSSTKLDINKFNHNLLLFIFIGQRYSRFTTCHRGYV